MSDNSSNKPVTLAVIIGAHSSWRWDEALYKIPALHPLMWVLERTISTPATHHAHHALTQDDGIGHYAGNFGNLLFLWDVIFGTARITRGEETFLLGENESTFIPMGTKHRIENPGKVTLHIIEVQSGSYLGEDDIVRFEDVYGRSQ